MKIPRITDKTPPKDVKKIHRIAVDKGSRGGLAGSDAQMEARRRNALLGGRAPEPANLSAMRRVAAALSTDGKYTAEERDFLQEAFIRLAPEKLYQASWQDSWGPRLESHVRRNLRGWGPPHRARALALVAAKGD
jgi:hypothetical protein